MIDLLGERNIHIDSELDKGTVISFEIHDKYSPLDNNILDCEVSEFAADDITSSIFCRSANRDININTLSSKNQLSAKMALNNFKSDSNFPSPMITPNKQPRPSIHKIFAPNIQQPSSFRNFFAPSAPALPQFECVDEGIEDSFINNNCKPKSLEYLEPITDIDKPLIVILDDENLNLIMLRKAILRIHPFAEIIEFTSPEACLNAIFKANCSKLFFFTDIELSSNLDGFIMAEKVAQCQEKLLFPVKVISYSSHSREFIRMKSRHFDETLSKPFNLEDLQNLIRKMNFF